MTISKSTVFLCILATFVACVSASLAANAPHDFPAGFTVSSNFREDIKRRTYFDFSAADFAFTPPKTNNMTHQMVDVVIELFASDLEKYGWTILRRQGTLVADKPNGGHDWWLSGNGNSGDFRLVFVEVAPPARSLTLKPPQPQVETVSDSQDLPYVLPLPGSKMEKTISDQRSFEIVLPNTKQTTLATSKMTRWYDEPAGVSSYEFAAVYRTALETAGWDITRSQVGGDAAITAHYGKNGRDIWLYTHGDGGKQSINVVDYGAESQAASLKQQLVREGHVALYGIYFDTDSSVPRPESEATLQNVLQLLKADTSLKLEVQGHTDDTGAPDHNVTLSDARAASVKQWLTGHGIAPAVLTSKGYGATKPVADNKTPEGRAKNRRVELVAATVDALPRR